MSATVDAVYDYRPGSLPLIVSIPHAGTVVPEKIRTRLSIAAAPLPDTDWHVDRLYDFADALGASVLAARLSRYVIDLNRPADGSALYPGQVESALVPLQTFAGEAIYRPGDEPDAREQTARIARYWQPYHDRLAAVLGELRARYGYVLLWDAHSIRSRVPRLFAGRLPDLNLGTAGGASCDARLRTRLEGVLGAQRAYSGMLDGRFRGGYITRHYGDPDRGIHAVQLELSQRCYMREETQHFDAEAADRLRPLIARLLREALESLERAG